VRADSWPASRRAGRGSTSVPTGGVPRRDSYWVRMRRRVARLSPLGDSHINVQGRYHFTITDAVLRGDLRPLRNPDETEDLLRG
jgi:hypothetical protein